MEYSAPTTTPFVSLGAVPMPPPDMPPPPPPPKVSAAMMITTAVIHKPTEDTPLGMSVSGGPGGVPVITKIDPMGLCSMSGCNIEPGQRILTVNGAACQSRDEFVAMTRSSLPGVPVVLQAGPVALMAATVTKTLVEQPVGISMAPEKRDNGVKTGALIITKVDPNGLFAKTDLGVGMQVVRINDQDVVGWDVKDVVTILRSITVDMDITIVANTATATRAKSKTPPRSRSPKNGERRWSYSKHTESMTSGRIVSTPEAASASSIAHNKRASFTTMAMNNKNNQLL